jgi:hypothetical protein
MRITAWLLCLPLLVAAEVASAQQMPALPTGVRIVLASCDALVLRKALLEQLRIELLSTGVVEIEVVDPDTGTGSQVQSDRIATLQVYYPECDDTAGLVNLRISDRLTAKYVERTLVVSDLHAEARPRAVALAIVELLRASWLELVIAQRPGESPEPSDTVRNRLVTHLKERTSDDPEVQRPERRRDSRAEDEALLAEERWAKNRLEWVGAGRFYPQGDSGDLSTTVKLSVALNRRLRLHTGALAAGGGVNSGRDVNMFEAAGVLGVGLSGGSEPEVEVASVFEVGWMRVSGQEVRDVGRVAATGTLQGTVRAPVAAGVDALIGVQAGYVLSPVLVKTAGTTGGQPAGGFQGPVVGVCVGLSGIL